jgi:hypothetical protein
MVACRILLDGSASEAAIRAETQERSTQFGVCGEGGLLHQYFGWAN